MSDPFTQALHQMVVPDLWQQEAVSALRQGEDVVVHAPTGAGKTLIFELWSGNGRPRGQAVYTVPTRALANDKLAEWRARGWNVGIATGDLSDNLDAPVIVATLETQKRTLLKGHGPSLLVIDEYQMLGDADRGLNYELAIALAPKKTQLLLLSGSVANPQDIVRWLQRLGRKARLVRTEQRPVPLEEVEVNHLSLHVPNEIRGYWPRFVAKALAEDLGPILIFAPRRAAAESLAGELSRNLPLDNPLTLTPAQKQIVGDSMARMLRTRVVFHHSGLSYATRAGVIEPLAKAGQLRVVVATMGLAAGINFSLRSVALAGESYRRDAVEHPLRADEILQMFGRAGRRGIDETGYVLVSNNELRLRDAYPAHLSRSGLVDWPALLGIMDAAAEEGLAPYSEAVRAQERLFSSKPIFIGVEESLKFPNPACGLQTDSERARRIRKRTRQLMNSRGEWEDFRGHTDLTLEGTLTPAPGGPTTDATATGAVVPPRLIPVIHIRTAVERVGQGEVCQIGETPDGPVYGRVMNLGDYLNDGGINLVKWVRRLVNVPSRLIQSADWEGGLKEKFARAIEEQQHYRLVRFEQRGHLLRGLFDVSKLKIKGPTDSLGVKLWKPREREISPPECLACPHAHACRALTPASGVALIWRRLGLVDGRGHPTRRGQIVSYFHQGDGLAIAAALEEAGYPLDELIYELANLDAGFRFSRDESRWGGRLAIACQQRYGNQSFPGYLENGLPLKYGAGAEVIVAAVHKDPQAKQAWINEFLGAGDIDRVIIEWRSLLRQIAHAPRMDWDRWTSLQQLAREVLKETDSPTCSDLPALDYSQTKRIDHRLSLRRH